MKDTVLRGYAMAGRDTDVLTPDGEMVPGYELILSNEGDRQIYRCQMTTEGKEGLLRILTGGIVLAGPEIPRL